MVRHFIEVETATGAIVGEWRNDTDLFPVPVAPAGREMVDITHENRDLGELSGKRYKWTPGVGLEEPTPTAPVLKKGVFFRLWTRSEIAAIGALQQAANADVLYFWTWFQLEDYIDLGLPETTDGVTSVFDAMVAASLITPEVAASEKARILAGIPPA